MCLYLIFWYNLMVAGEKAAEMPIAAIGHDAIRAKFLQRNTAWLLSKLPALLTPRSIDQNRETLRKLFDDVVKAGARPAALEISTDSDSSDDDEAVHRGIVLPLVSC